MVAQFSFAFMLCRNFFKKNLISNNYAICIGEKKNKFALKRFNLIFMHRKLKIGKLLTVIYCLDSKEHKKIKTIRTNLLGW